MKDLLIRPFIGKKRYQPFFEFLFDLSLQGMNLGGGSDVNDSGEKRVLNRILKNRGAEFILFDVGANIGSYTQLAISINPKINIFCFEPSKKTYEVMEDRITQLNNSRIYPHNLGFGDKKGHVNLYSDQEKSGLSSVYKRRLDHFNIKMDIEETIFLDTIDEFCNENNIEYINLLKLDVEGNELSVLKGSLKLISENRIHAIQFEFGGCNIDSKTYFQDFFYLLYQKYKLYRILVDGLQEIEGYSELNEIFTTTNYLAINKKVQNSAMA